MQQGVVPRHVLRGFPDRQLIQLLMVIGVVPHLMPLGRHALHNIRILYHLAANYKKCGVYIPRFQAVQQLRRTSGRGAVVKCEGHIFASILHQCGIVYSSRGAFCLWLPRACADGHQQQRYQQYPLSLHPITPPQYMRGIPGYRTGQRLSPVLFFYIMLHSASVISTHTSKYGSSPPP